MFERFSGNARQAVVLAQEEARKLKHNYIGTEHLLLGLMAMPESSAGRAFRRLGLTREAASGDVERIVGRGDREPSGHVPFTRRAKKVLELSLREALKLKHNYIGSGHILLAIVREGEGVAAQVLHERLGDLDKVRDAARAELSGSEPRSPAAAARTPATEEVLRLAEQLAAGAPVGSHHLLEALARSHRSMAALVLAGLGVDPDTIAARLDTIEPESTSDVTPELAAASKMRLRLAGDEVHLVLRDTESVELVRQLTDLAGEQELRGDEPLSGPFVMLWTSTRNGLFALRGILAPETPADEPAAGEGQGRTILNRLRARRRQPDQPED